MIFAYGAITRCGSSFQTNSANQISFLSLPRLLSTNLSYNPRRRKRRRVWADPFSLAATKGMKDVQIVRHERPDDLNISLFSFPPGTEMFYFPGYSLPT